MWVSLRHLVPLMTGGASLVLLLGACASDADRSSGSILTTTTSPRAVTTTTVVDAATTSTQAAQSGRVGLFRAEPDTLAPIPGTTPLTAGDWLSGTMSPNREWLVLNVWIDTEPDTDVIRVVEVASGRVVTDVTGSLRHDLRVGDDGAVFSLSESTASGLRLERLDPGGAMFQTVFDGFPDQFSPWSPTMLFGREQVGWLGTIGSGATQSPAAIVVGDLSSGSSNVYPLPDVALGFVGEHDLGDWVAPEIVEPAVVWDFAANRVLVVHADESAVTVVELGTGEVREHRWSPTSSWAGSLLAWLAPPADAKGPSFGASRHAVLSPDRDLVYVASSRAEIVSDEDGQWAIESTPQGVVAISTETWEVVDRWDIPASQVFLSPNGAYLVATGLRRTDTLATSEYQPEGAFIVRTDTGGLIGRIDTPGDWYPDIQFSPDSTYLYATAVRGGRIDVIDLKSGQVIQSVRGPEQLAVFGEAALISTTKR
jgi:DNA-binding beta-propeller fold protein YncE